MKKNKLKPWTLLVATLLMGTMSFAQSIHFNYTDGTNAAYNLVDIRKVTFDADVMNLHLLDGSIYAWNVSTIGYYQYDESSVSALNLLNNANAWEVNVYPNPTSTSLNISFNLPQADVISINLFDTQGKLVSEKQIGKKESGKYQEVIDLTNIPQGTYVCRIAGKHNTITKQIIKQ
jgi:hypothetical protein